MYWVVQSLSMKERKDSTSRANSKIIEIYRAEDITMFVVMWFSGKTFKARLLVNGHQYVRL